MLDEAYYRNNAKKSCEECRGHGLIKYQLDQDKSEVYPCLLCFPNDLAAQAGEKMKSIMEAVESDY